MRFLLALVLTLAAGPAHAQYVQAVAVTGYTFSLVDKVDGTPITSGTVTGYRTIDGGTQTELTGTFTHEGNGQWSISSLSSTEMDGATIGLLLLHADAQPLNINLITTPAVIAAAADVPSAATIADAVWDELYAAHSVEGSFAASLNYVNITAGSLETKADGAISGIEDLQTTIGVAGAGLTDLPLDDLASDISEALDSALTAAITPFAAKDVHALRTWRPGADGATADNIVTVKRLFAGSLMAYLPLNEDGDIQGVASVTITGPASVTATNLRKSGDGRAVIFDVPSLTTAGTYAVVPIGTTADDNEIPLDCKLVVRP